MLMLGICMCHSIGAGGYCYAPLRNICMMCTVGFIFITGWFGVRLSAQRVLKLLGIAIFAWGVVILEDIILHGSVTTNPLRRLVQWWFLNSYLMLLCLSPILNSIVRCVQSEDISVRKEGWLSVIIIAFAIYGLAWPMHCKWIHRVRFFLTLGSPCQFGTMCAIYLLARVVKVTNILDETKNWAWWMILFVTMGLAIYSHKFSYYNSPFAFLFALSIFSLTYRIPFKECWCARLLFFVAPSMFFVYLYHSHQDPGFVAIKMFEKYMVSRGVFVPLAWIITAVSIFLIGLLIDMVRRGGVAMATQPLRSIFRRRV